MCFRKISEWFSHAINTLKRGKEIKGARKIEEEIKEEPFHDETSLKREEAQFIKEEKEADKLLTKKKPRKRKE